MITLPEDTAASRLHREPREQEDVLDTLREYERLARTACPDYTIASRFSADGETWVPVWLKDEPPAAVHTAVVRDGVGTEEWRSWKEALPAEGEGREEWLQNPATRLRAFVERATLRRAFADVIVGRDRHAPESPTQTAGDPWAPAGTTLNDAAEPISEPRPTPRAPQDHLPGNRAERRARTKKKGRR